MRTLLTSAVVLATGLAIGPLLFAQAAPVALPGGDAVRGKAIFESTKANCLSCHRVNGVGSLYGPDLSAIGAPPRGGGGGRGGGAAAGGNARGAGPAPVPGAPPAGAPAAGAPPAATPAAGRAGGPVPGGASVPMAEQLAQSILDPNAVVTAQNRYVRLSMKDGKTVWGKLLNLDTFDVQIFEPTEKLTNVSRKDVREMTMTSPMPSYRDKLAPQELADVISYLMSLKGQ